MKPGIHGAGVLKILRGQMPLATLPMVILSSQRESETVQTVIQLGVAGFLLKPLHLEARPPASGPSSGVWPKKPMRHPLPSPGKTETATR